MNENNDEFEIIENIKHPHYHEILRCMRLKDDVYKIIKPIKSINKYFRFYGKEEFPDALDDFDSQDFAKQIEKSLDEARKKIDETLEIIDNYCNKLQYPE